MLLLKPKFEQARHEALKRLKPMREAEVAQIQAKLVEFLDSLHDILVERARRPNHTDPLVEINGAWMGPASSHKEIESVFKAAWPWPAFEGLQPAGIVEHADEWVIVRFVATDAERYITGKVQIRT